MHKMQHQQHSIHIVVLPSQAHVSADEPIRIGGSCNLMVACSQSKIKSQELFDGCPCHHLLQRHQHMKSKKAYRASYPWSLCQYAQPCKWWGCVSGTTCSHSQCLLKNGVHLSAAHGRSELEPARSLEWRQGLQSEQAVPGQLLQPCDIPLPLLWLC